MTRTTTNQANQRALVTHGRKRRGLNPQQVAEKKRRERLGIPEPGRDASQAGVSFARWARGRKARLTRVERVSTLHLKDES